MPNKPVTVKRWELVAIFVLIVLAAAGSAQWANYHTNARIDQAERRINTNRENIASNRVHAVIAADLAEHAKKVVEEQQQTIHILCGEIAAVKAQIVDTLRSSSGGSQDLVGRIPGYTQADADRAEARLQQAIKRFAPRPCPPK